MNLRYESFCFADPLFFDERHVDHDDDRATEVPFSETVPAPPAAWNVADHGIWRRLLPPNANLPDQGWKIHVSTTLDAGARVLRTVSDYCIAAGVAFKYLRTPTILLIQNSKYCDRESSGKFVTIYPPTTAALRDALEDLSTLLAGEAGPYVLSDLRFGTAPVFVRYGGFVPRFVDHDGDRVPAIRCPDGTLVPDRREPRFTVPEWVELPAFLQPHLAARRGAGSTVEFPYRVSRPLHFSNAGGVYLATRVGDPPEAPALVLKEARPHAGLDRQGADAVTRLCREQSALAVLSGVRGIPRVYERRTVWEHEFLAMEHLPGIPLGRWMGLNYPLGRHGSTQADRAHYVEQALEILAQVAEMLRQMHGRGLVYGDLHAANVLVRTSPDGGEPIVVSLVDFELAYPVDTATNPGLGAAGFRPPEPRTGTEIDAYALAALRLWLFLPLNAVLELAPEKLDTYLATLDRWFPLPEGYTDGIREQLAARTERGQRFTTATREIEQERPDWDAVSTSIAEAVLASATPERHDRLFPGDIEQFALGGAGFGVGAAGVLYALHAAGFGRFPHHERWLLDAITRDRPLRPGFGHGAHGIAYALDSLGHRDAAVQLVEDSTPKVERLATDQPDTAHELNAGLAGVGLTQLHLTLLPQACDTAHRLAALLTGAAPLDPGGPTTDSVGRAGLLHGWSGPSVLFTRLFGHTGDASWLTLADQALRRDLWECVPTEDGSMQVQDRTRTLPYLGVGSAGVLVAANLLAEAGHEFDPPHPPIAALRAACRGTFCAYPGLMYGRAGLVAALAPHEADIGAQLSTLGLYTVPFQDRIAFVGTTHQRLSMDVNTGGAGVLLALAVTRADATLPFLEPLPRSPQTSGQS